MVKDPINVKEALALAAGARLVELRADGVYRYNVAAGSEAVGSVVYEEPFILAIPIPRRSVLKGADMISAIGVALSTMAEKGGLALDRGLVSPPLLRSCEVFKGVLNAIRPQLEEAKPGNGPEEVKE